MAIPEKELDYHYSPSRWSHRFGPDEVIEAHLKSVTEGTKVAHWCLECDSAVTYGTGEKQKLDIFNAKMPRKMNRLPVLVYLHGGYWQHLGLEMSGFMAPPLCKAGATVISVGYDLAPEASMDKIVSEIKQAMRYILRYAKERQSRGIYLCGHSAGGHLAAMMLACEFAEDDAFDSEMIKGAALISGVYDLRPLTKTYVNDPLKLNEEDAWRFSPANFIAEIAGLSQQRDILIAVAEYDPPEFRRQSADLEKSVVPEPPLDPPMKWSVVKELSARKVKTRYMDVSDTDHFDVIEKLQKDSYRLTTRGTYSINYPGQPSLEYSLPPWSSHAIYVNASMAVVSGTENKSFTVSVTDSTAMKVYGRDVYDAYTPLPIPALGQHYGRRSIFERVLCRSTIVTSTPGNVFTPGRRLLEGRSRRQDK
ncbi:kynurenine formamidase-like [Haliotis rubra]|uniref:kynurenine formamidase-like n=1 Tax=Haliotis rubra TaxID=36100 RepID=UPI001EE5C1F2|nr:kynurenine formamidase-like [Haliotis rubra]